MVPNYNFDSLSSNDFEILVKDLLQKELQINLENFKSGRDSGIDLRYSRNLKQSLIVQCKHYHVTGIKGLLAQIKKEEHLKVKKLSPQRYILATSVDLSPQNKNEIVKLFNPFIRDYSDVMGKQDLNNLLSKHPDIEKNNFKLWLTSRAVLDRVLHSAIYSKTEIEVEKIMLRMKHYVQNESFFRAKNIMKEINYCIIAGIPGIGKTTLAEMLLIDYLQKGYRVFKITSDIDEAYTVINRIEKMVFYYDDFLGVTTLNEKLNKNEDKKLIEFIEHIKSTRNKKFILTTREYILNSAKRTYERLSTSKFDYKKCVIDMSDYTKNIRAHIFFNHIYFSDLPNSYKMALLKENGFLKIIKHKNYNPRVIETISDYQKLLFLGCDLPSKYLNTTLKILNNPQLLWEHPFTQLSFGAKNILYVLVSMTDEIYLKDLEDGFMPFHLKQCEKYNEKHSREDFKNALSELEGNFISSYKDDEEVIVKFHNPSIRDYMEEQLLQNVKVMREIIESAYYLDQIKTIRNLVKSEKNVKKIHFSIFNDLICKSLERVLNNRGCYLSNMNYRSGYSRKMYFKESYELRLAFVLSVYLENGIENNAVLESAITKLIKLTSENKTKITNLVVFLNQYRLLNTRGDQEKELLCVARRRFNEELKSVTEVEDFKYLLEFYDLYKMLFSKSDYGIIKNKFVSFCEQEAQNAFDYDDPAMLKQTASAMHQLSLRFKVNLNSEIDTIDERAEEIYQSGGGQEDEGLINEQGEDKELITDKEICDLFDSLRN